MTPRFLIAPLMAVIGLFPMTLPAEDGPLPVAKLERDTPVDFYSEVLPFLRRNCLACHNETKAKADLILENPESILTGGDTGPSVEPGNADYSLLFTTAAHIEEPVMPPANNKSKAKNLTPEELALLQLWIQQGAKGGNQIAMPAPETWRKLDQFQEIYALAVSPDGRFAACGRGHVIHVYDLRLNKLVATLTDPDLKGSAHRDLVQSLAFSPDGTLASGGFRVVKLWERADVLPTAVEKAPAAGPLSVQSPDKKWKVDVAEGGKLKLTVLPASEEKPPVDIAAHGKKVVFLAALSATEFVSVGEDGFVHVWDSTGKKVRSITFGGPAKTAALHPDRKRLAVMAPAGKVRAFNLADGQELMTLDMEPELLVQIEELKREEAMAKRLSDLYGKEVPTLEAAQTKEQETAEAAAKEIPVTELAVEEKAGVLAQKQRSLQLAQHAAEQIEPGEENKAALDAAQKVVTTAETEVETARTELATAERQVRLARRNRGLGVQLTGEAARELSEAKTRKAAADAAMESLKAQREAKEKRRAEEWPKLALAGIAWSPDGTQLSLAQATGTVTTWTADGAFLETMSAGGELTDVGYTQKGALTTVSKDGQRTTWASQQPWELARTIGDGDDSGVLIDRVTALAFSPTGDRLATGSGVPSRSGRVKIWGTETGDLLAENLESHSDTVSEMVFSPVGDQVASASTDKFVKVFDASSGEEDQSFEAHTGHVLGVAWSDDARLIASASADTEVKLWSLKTGEQIKTLKGWQKEVTSVSFLASNSDAVVTTSGDASLKIDTAALSGSSGFLYQARVSEDGKLILAGGEDGVLRVWTAADRKLVRSFQPPEQVVER